MHVGHPVAHRLVHGVFERAGAAGDGADLGAQEVHAEDVGLLPLDVGGAHVDDARQAEAGADGGGRHAMLAGAGLGDDAGLAHAHGQEDLAHAVVDLVRAGVVQLLALEIDLGPAEVGRQPLGEIERARPADIVGQEAAQLGLEGRVGLGRRIGAVELEHQRHQGLGDIKAAVVAESALRVGIGRIVVGFVWTVHWAREGFEGWSIQARRTASRKLAIRPASFSPAPRSTPEETSTRGARVMAMASVTFQGSRPPARK